MPLTDFQREAMAAVVGNRSEASHVAGGLVLNAEPESARFSQDFDFFHDPADALAEASEKVRRSWLAADFEVQPSADWVKPETFRPAR